MHLIPSRVSGSCLFCMNESAHFWYTFFRVRVTQVWHSGRHEGPHEGVGKVAADSRYVCVCALWTAFYVRARVGVCVWVGVGVGGWV